MKNLLLIPIICLVCPHFVHAGFIQTPSLTPSLELQVKFIQDKKPLNIKKRLINTPAREYDMIYKGKSIEVFEDSINKIYIQKISLEGDARISSHFDFHSFDEKTGEPLYSRFSPKDKLRELPKPPISFINGQFFDPSRRETPFSFGFKYRQNILTTGADNRDEQKNIFSFSPLKGARVIPYSLETFLSDTSEFAIVSLSLEEDHANDILIGRTYICLLSPDADGYSKKLMTFTFLSATEIFARSILQSWGCQSSNVSKLDASGSSVFGLQDTIYYGNSKKGSPDYRKIPQIIGFYEE